MAQLRLDKLTEEELIALRSEINDMISEYRKMERSEETALLRKKYEGKFFYDANKQLFFHIVDVIDKYNVNAWVFSVSRDPNTNMLDKLVVQYIVSPADGISLLVPQLSMQGTVMQPSAISSCEEISEKDAKKLIGLLFNEIGQNFFEE